MTPTSETTTGDLPDDNLPYSLAAYIPVTLTRRILEEGLPRPGEPHSLLAATLFSDISGFTAMSEELASDGPRGAEELNRVLLVTFTAMIDVIHEMGGAISHFYGDAMSIYFPDVDGQAARRALACAQMMQQLMLTSFDRVVTNRPPGKHPFFQLTIKIGVGYGRCQELVVGSPESGMEFVLTGPAVDEAAQAEKQAGAGEVIASRAVLEQAGVAANADFELFLSERFPAPAARPILNWDNFSSSDRAQLVDQVTPFLPRALYQRLLSTGSTDLAEHRPVTSLFVQFTFAGDEDETSAIETAAMGRLLQQYYVWACQIVKRFGQGNARVNRVLTGDKGNQLHIMFGAPVAPDAPEQAARCALALLREQPDFIASQRIGMAVGKVFAGPVGATNRREYTVVGDVVNLSARLMQACEDGMIWADRLTAERTRQWIEYEVLSAIRLKGKQAAIRPYQVKSDRGAITKLQAYTERWERPLVGREQEVDLLLGGMDAALRRIGGAAAIYGPTGVGKSRLLATGVKYWLEAQGQGLIGICYQHTSDTPYGPWRDVWREYFGLTAGMSTDEQVSVVIEETKALVPDVGDDVALWRELLGLPIPQPVVLEELSAEARQARLFQLVRRGFLALARKKPLLIIVEGLQWADQASLALLDDLTGHLDGASIFVAFTFRPNASFELQTLNRAACIPIVLSDLSPRYARQLLDHLVGAEELPAAVEQQLGLRDREGRDSPVNPLFLEEALNVMMAAGMLELNGRVRVNESLLAQMQVPDTIHGLLLARLDRLSPTSRDLLQVASVIGRQFAVEPLSVITSQPTRQTIINLLAELSEAEMTRLITADPEWIYLFQHAMTHEVAYESLPFSRRQRLHAAVARWLEDRYRDNLKPLHPVLAYHYSRALNHERGLHFALLAADEARNIFANKEAVELYTLAENHLQALGVADRWETAVHLYLSRGEAQRFLGDYSRATADVEQAVSLALDFGRAIEQARAFNLLAELKGRQAQFQEAKKLSQRVLNELKDNIPVDEQARAHQWLGFALSATGEYEEALSHLHQAEQLCLQTQNNERLARVLETTAFVYYSQKQLEQALTAMQRSVDLFRDISIPVNVASSLSNIALIQFQLGKAEEALATLNDAIAFVQDASRNYLARFLGNKAEVLSYLGQFDEARSLFNEAIDLFVAMDDEQGLLEVYIVQGYECDAVLFDWERAKRQYAQAQQIIDQYTNKFPEEQARLLIGLGQMELATGSPEAAAGVLETAVQLIDQKGFAWWRPAALYYFALCQQRQQNYDRALDLLVEAKQAVSEEGCPDYLPLITLQQARLANDLQTRSALTQEAVQQAERRARYMDKLYCLQAAVDILSDINEEQYHLLVQTYVDRIKKTQNEF